MMTALPLRDYRDAVALDEPFHPLSPPAPARRLGTLTSTALRMLGEDPWVGRFALPRGLAEQRRLLRNVLTVRERQLGPLVDVRSLGPLAVWRGDITQLMCDAIVNAANDALLGCFQPMHSCVDNAIHAAAGPRLRADCHRIMAAQAAPEPTGTAKITRGYHLPASFVLRTVGPIVGQGVGSPLQRAGRLVSGMSRPGCGGVRHPHDRVLRHQHRDLRVSQGSGRADRGRHGDGLADGASRPVRPDRSSRWLDSSDRVLIAAGLSAAAGYDYSDTVRFAELFPALRRRGLSAWYQLIGLPLPLRLLWGYWAVHVQDAVVGGARHGRYQCETPCTRETWESRPIVEAAVAGYDAASGETSAVPPCPRCGGAVFLNVHKGPEYVPDHYEPAGRRLRRCWRDDHRGARTLVRQSSCVERAGEVSVR